MSSNKDDLQYSLENFICDRLEATLWENEQFDKDTVLFKEQLEEAENNLIHLFGTDTRLHRGLTKIIDLLISESTQKQQRAYAIGFKDGLKFEETLSSI
ncbi:hypothetical protein UMC2_15781 [[Clostridium] sordellii]|uniref:hypothetical protein n=1 Tax=Paraclostridium sordellii TaxID=1505 RepID=UPI0005440C4E|nr:hypothetical protein [Paeniclostridium sordellii]CEK34622.1 hypothetical protein UMC2_15781 [[Clostridium] sordellii] [Paeniclostridium sordellii]